MLAPGSRIGVLGAGQLGRMMTHAAQAMGYRVTCMSPEDDSPTAAAADASRVAAWTDLDQVAAFADGVDVVTLEFENVPTEVADVCAERAPLRPSRRVLATCQDRLQEKAAMADLGIPTAPWSRVDDRASLAREVARLDGPAVLKSARSGYDGKGQARVDGEADLDAAWERAGPGPCILESFIDFRCEVSVVAARSPGGARADWGPVENDHVNHVLDLSVLPARVSPAAAARAREVAHAVLEGLGVVGVLCVEMFLTHDDEVLVNELAPRPHNSGHLTIEASVTSQFEQQVRAVTGLPLGATTSRPAAMVNLLGDLWAQGPPAFHRALERPDVHLHLYGKHEARPGRKMGHITALGASPDEAAALALAARADLTGS